MVVWAGTGEAWSHPHSSNLLYTSTTNTGGFMMNGTYTSDGWAAQNDPSGNQTWFDWRIPNPNFAVRTNDDQIEAWEWPLGSALM